MRKIKVEMMKHTLLYIGMALAFFAMQPDAAQAKTKKPAKVEKQQIGRAHV